MQHGSISSLGSLLAGSRFGLGFSHARIIVELIYAGQHLGERECARTVSSLPGGGQIQATLVSPYWDGGPAP